MEPVPGCDLCEATRAEELYPAGDGRWRHVRCGCGLLYVCPLPTGLAEVNQRLYGGEGAAVRRPRRAKAILRRARRRGARAVVDVGCGAGAFLAEAAALGLNAIGFDPLPCPN